MAIDVSQLDPRAVEWIDRLNAGTGLSGNWRLQVIQRRYRKKEIGACGHELPIHIRRFASGCPWALVNDAIRYLLALAPYGKTADEERTSIVGKQTEIVYNGLVLDGSYRPTLTQWMRDEQSTVDEQQPRNGTYTLVQDLIEVSECPDSEESSTGSSCSEDTVTEWHWDDDAPGDLASIVEDRCEQGVTYAITQVNRKEDGTFDWALVKRTAKTQHFGPTVVECNHDSVTTVETWDNLYGSEGSFEAHTCDSVCGTVTTPVIIPTTCDDPTVGERVQVQISQNPDCTFKAVVTKRTSKMYDVDWTEGTACREVSVQHVFNSHVKPEDTVPSVGETVQAQVSRNEDGTYNSQVRVTAAPEEVELHWTDGSKCRPRLVSQYTNMRSKPALPEFSAGESLSASYKKNDDCTWDASFQITKPAPSAMETWQQGSPCRPETVYSYQNSDTKPDIPKLEDGKVISASIRKNDDCTWDGQVSVKTSPAEDSFDWVQGSECRKEYVTRYMRSKTKPTVPEAKDGKTVQASISKNEDDCTYDAQVTVVDPPVDKEYDWTSGEDCRTVALTQVYENRDEPVVPPPLEEGSVRSVDVSFDDRTCLYTTRVRTVKTSSYDSGLITWMAYDESPGGSWRRTEHALRVFSHVKVLPVPTGDHGWTMSFDINEDCTYTGRMGYSDLKEWGSASGTEGGIVNAAHKEEPNLVFDGPNGSKYGLDIITFTGSGNEGTEAYWKAHGVKAFPVSLTLPARTYVKKMDQIEPKTQSKN